MISPNAGSILLGIYEVQVGVLAFFALNEKLLLLLAKLGRLIAFWASPFDRTVLLAAQTMKVIRMAVTNLQQIATAMFAAGLL